MTTQALFSERAYVAVSNAEHHADYAEEYPRNHGRPDHLQFGLPLTRNYWKPFSLRPVGLMFFATILVGILTVLIATWSYARSHQGLSLITTNHYTWTFGPTAIFILVISYWRLVDYHTKALSPWAELANGPSPTDRTLFLDYVSALLQTAFWLASKKDTMRSA